MRWTMLGAALAALLLAACESTPESPANQAGSGGSGGEAGGDGGTGGEGGFGGEGGGGGVDEPQGRLRFIDIYPAVSISADGTVAAIVDSLSGVNDVFLYDVASGELQGATSTGHPERYVNGFSADGKTIIGSRGEIETPAIWSEERGWVDLPTIGTCDGKGSGWQLSADGSVAVGLLWTDDCMAAAARWTETGEGYELTQLEVLSGGDRATAVSADGSLAGGFAEGHRTPVIWREDGTGQFLTEDHGSGEVLAVSADGKMVAGNLGEDGFYWTEETGVVSIGTLHDPLGSPYTLATAIAADNQLIFGGSGHRVFSTQRAFVWTEEAGMRSLEKIAVDHGLEIRQDFVLSHVLGASSDGSVVVGFASNPETMEWISFVLELPISAYGL